MWRKSTYSADNGCVEVAFDGGVRVRDSKDPDGPPLAIPRDQWPAFLAAAVAWDPDGPPAHVAGVGIHRITRGWCGLTVCLIDDRCRHLHFTPHEWDAFVAGVKEGQFDG